MLKAIGDFSDVTSNVKQVQSVLNQIKVPKNLQESFTGIFDDLTAETKKYQKFLDSGFKKKSDVTGLEASGARINNLLKRLKVEMGKISQEDLEKSFQIDPSKLQNLANEAKNLQSQLQAAMSTTQVQNYTNAVDAAAKEMAKVSKTDFAKNFADAFKKGNLEEAKAALASMQKQLNRFTKGTEGFQKYENGINAMGTALGNLVKYTNIEKLTQDIKDNQQAMQNLGSTELNAYIKAFEDGKITLEQFTSAVKGLINTQKDSANATHQQATELDQLKDRAKHFFSLANSVQLFKRVLRETVNTVKELDKTMTEAAVVTDFSIGDMWEQLPNYSKAARDLGISINSMYQATTLYYQQGLKTQEAMELGVETMKMAKIAGLESEDATKAMTAALRGFNMELNEMSATRVNDVYSQLAAVTAADVSQISTAMEKTASIAASANMEFETTAALLAQIIETTQEAPETAGTAMKTIIARFSEVKGMRERGEVTGQDEEGEDIDVNRIQAALRTVGISMEGFFAGTEGLDSILLKLAEKWQGLDFETQRYIATMAAGSRQQSRFIAMMSDYERTIELVGQAQNSTGASQRQFEKTTESLETAINRLKASWDEFTMRIADEGLIKFAINSITRIVGGINQVTGALEKVAGPLGTISSLIVTIGAFKFGKIAAGSLFGGTKMGQKLGLGKEDSQTKPYLVKSVRNKQGGRGEDLKQNFRRTFVNDQTSIKNFDAKAVKDNLLKQAKGGPREALLTKQLEDAGDSFDKIKATADDYNNTLDKAKEKELNFGQALEETGAKIKSSTLNMQSLGVALMGAGMATSLLASGFEALGMDEAAEAAETLGGIITALGSGIMVLSMVLGPATAGTTLFSAAWWSAAIPILATVGAILALVAVMAFLWWLATKNPLEEAMEEAKEATLEAAKAAEEAKKAYDDLLEDKKQYKSLQERLASLTKHTNEWRQAMLEANEQVLQMVQDHPELAQYLTTGAYGELSFTSEGMAKAEETALTRREQASGLLAVRQYIEAQATYDYWESQQEMTEQIAKDIVNSASSYVEAQTTGATHGTSYSEEDRKAASEYLETRQTSLAGLDNKAYAALSAMSSDLSSDKTGQLLLRAASKNFDGSTFKGQELSEVIRGDAEDINDFLGEYMKKLDPSFDAFAFDNKSKDDQAEYLYKTIFKEEVPEELKGNTEKIIDAIEKFINADKTVEWLKQINQTLLKSSNPSKWAAIFAQDAGGLQLSDFSSSGKLEGSYADFLKTGITLEDLETQWNVEGFLAAIDKFHNIKTTFNTAYSDLETDLLNWGTSIDKVDDIYEKATLDQARAIGAILSGAEARTGTEELSGLFTGIMDSVSSENQEVAMNLISTEKWIDKDSIDATIDQLRTLGATIDNDFVEAIYNATGAVRKFNAASFAERMNKITEIKDTVQSKIDDGSKTFTLDERDALIKQGVANAEDFIALNWNEFAYTDTMVGLLALIEEHTGVMAKETINDLDKKIVRGENYKAAMEEGGFSETIFSTIQEDEGELSEGTLKFWASLLGYSPGDYENLTSEQLKTLLLEGYEDYKDLEKNKSLKEEQTETNEQIAFANMVFSNKQEGINDNSEEQTRYLDEMYKAYPELAAYIVEHNKELKLGGREFEELSNKQKAYALAMAKTNIEAREFGKIISENADKLNSSNQQEKEEAFQAILAQAQAQYGSHINMDFIKSQEEVLKRIANGEKSALQEFLDASYQVRLEVDFEKGEARTAADNIVKEVQSQLSEENPVVTITAEADWNSFGYIQTNFDKMVSLMAAKGIKMVSTADGIKFYKTGPSDVVFSPSGGGGSSNNYENSYDRLHNILEEINDTLREREKLERQYQRLLDRNEANADKLIEKRQAIIQTYQDEIANQNAIIEGRKQQLAQEMQMNKKLENLIYTEIGADGNQSIRINWAGLEAIRQGEEGEAAEKYYNTIKEWLESIYEAQTAIEEAQDRIYEETLQGKDEYLNLEEQIKEAIIAERQEEIDSLSAINESINDTNAKLIESLQTSLEKQRQDRENQKTEDELADKQRRLAYLQQDTSGANAKEILQLQKEIEEGTESYTDRLIDQKISELQQQNDKAAEQRQQQIDILQATLDKEIESGELWKEVGDLIKQGTSMSGGLTGERLETILKSSAGFEGMSEIQQMDWLNETNNLIASALSYGKVTEGKVSQTPLSSNFNLPYGSVASIKEPTSWGSSAGDIKALQYALSMIGYDTGGIDGVMGQKTANALSAFKRKIQSWDWATVGKRLQEELNKVLSELPTFKTGGLADFTGPAWLDGTKSRPEYILNTDQTKAFFNLVDVLGSLQTSSFKTAQNSGDNTYDIDINVESIGSDYDVEQLATTVKRLINEDARYRNNNTINLTR